MNLQWALESYQASSQTSNFHQSTPMQENIAVDNDLFPMRITFHQRPAPTFCLPFEENSSLKKTPWRKFSEENSSKKTLRRKLLEESSINLWIVVKKESHRKHTWHSSPSCDLTSMTVSFSSDTIKHTLNELRKLLMKISFATTSSFFTYSKEDDCFLINIEGGIRPLEAFIPINSSGLSLEFSNANIPLHHYQIIKATLFLLENFELRR